MKPTKLADVCAVIVDSEHKTAPAAQPGKEYALSVGTPHIRGGRLLLRDAVAVDEETYRQWTVREVPMPGDLILTREAPVGEVGIIPNETRVCLRQRTVLLKPDSSLVDGRFLLYLLMAPDIQDDMHSRGGGSTVPHLNIKDIRSLSLGFLPGLRNQQEIARILGALDDKIALNERMRDVLLDLAKAHYVSAGVGGERERIGDIANLFDGPHATPQKTDNGPWFLSISSLKSGYLDLAESAHLSEEDFPRWTRRVQPRAGDVLFSYETRLGDAALMPPGVRGSLGRRMALLRSKSPSVSGALLLHAYLSPAFQEEVKRRTIHGATVGRLPLKEMPAWWIHLPAVDERVRLSAKLESLHASVTQTAVENRTLTDLRDTLLPQLLSGTIRVKDAIRTVEGAI